MIRLEFQYSPRRARRRRGEDPDLSTSPARPTARPGRRRRGQPAADHQGPGPCIPCWSSGWGSRRRSSSFVPNRPAERWESSRCPPTQCLPPTHNFLVHRHPTGRLHAAVRRVDVRGRLPRRRSCGEAACRSIRRSSRHSGRIATFTWIAAVVSLVIAVVLIAVWWRSPLVAGLAAGADDARLRPVRAVDRVPGAPRCRDHRRQPPGTPGDARARGVLAPPAPRGGHRRSRRSRSAAATRPTASVGPISSATWKRRTSSSSTPPI